MLAWGYGVPHEIRVVSLLAYSLFYSLTCNQVYIRGGEVQRRFKGISRTSALLQTLGNCPLNQRPQGSIHSVSQARAYPPQTWRCTWNKSTYFDSTDDCQGAMAVVYHI
jgi:hypothetical protein